MSKHTPGPWTAYPCALERFSQVITAKGCMVQIAHTDEIYGDRLTFDPYLETVSNARLIAAAPDLLAALKELEPFMHEGAALLRAREAIAKAEGLL